MMTLSLTTFIIMELRDIVLGVITLSIAFSHCYAECHCAECQNVECHYAECHYDECHYAECHGARTGPDAYATWFKLLR